MINKNILSSIFDNYDIQKVVLIQKDETYNFIISNMSSSLTLERWEYLENILKDITKKSINIIPFPQAEKYFDSNLLNKGLVIKQ